MIHVSPQLQGEDVEALALVGELKDRLRHFTQHNPRRWGGSLRRAMFAKAIQGSNSIEGFNVDIDTAVAAIEQEEPVDERTETWMAIAGYQAAMTYIIQAAQDPYFEFSKQFLKSLQFMIAGYSMKNQPGQWRTTMVYVVNSKSGETVYTPPDVETVDPLIDELVWYLKEEANEHPLVRAAMAHLNLTMIHPFKDGNGRVSRALQTLVIAQGGDLHPVFCSIEEWLGDNTQAYYDILTEIGQGAWSPHRDALPWVRFCIKAHYQQAAKMARRNEDGERLYDAIMKLIELERLPDRSWMPLFDAALGLKVTNSRYRNDAEITDFTASRDLKRLSECGLLQPHGEKRARTYSATKVIKDVVLATRIKRPIDDPYKIIARRKGTPSQDEWRLPGL